MAVDNLMKCALWLCWLSAVWSAAVKRPGDQRLKLLSIHMPGRQPLNHDEYAYTSLKVDPGYIRAFFPTAHADRVHHMILYGCRRPAHTLLIWTGFKICAGPPKILYAWARNAPALDLPPDVGFPIGHPGDGVNYLVLQMHYAATFNGDVRDYSGVTLRISEDRPKYLASIYLFVGMNSIPAGKSEYYVNMSCPYYDKVTLRPFAFRTHTHGMGRVVSAFIHKPSGHWYLIGKRNPQWPQLFEKINRRLVIEPGDKMYAQCRYDSSGATKDTEMGATGADEMCNFYMMFYHDAKKHNPFPQYASCPIDKVGGFENYPPGGSSLMAVRPELESHAHQSGISFGVVEKGMWQQFGDVKLGQIAGMAIDPNGRLVVFHRGNRVWDYRSFDNGNRLNDRSPIDVDTVLTLDVTGATPTVFSSFGSGLFYMPHGIFVDSNGDIYTTDVGSHQVIKFTKSRENVRAALTLGVQFEPGSDRSHFCQPAAVSVSKKDGSIYVADGYCNSRIVVFSADGRYLDEWGVASRDAAVPSSFHVPHDLHIDNKQGLVHVADRENARMQAFALDGTFVDQLQMPEKVDSLYSLDYRPASIPGGVDSLFLMPGRPPKSDPKNGRIRAYVANTKTKQLMYSFAPKMSSQQFTAPHVIRVDNRGQYVYIGEISQTGGVVWRFEIKRDRVNLTGGHGMLSGGHNHQGHDHAKHPHGSDSDWTDEKVAPATSDTTPAPHKRSIVRLLALAVSAILLPVMLGALAYSCVKYRQRTGHHFGNFYNDGKPLLSMSFGKHNGFERLSTEDIDGVDDVTTEEESDQEDTIYPLKQPLPLNAVPSPTAPL